MPTSSSGNATFHIFAKFMSKVDEQLHFYVNDSTQHVIAIISPIATILLSIYMCMWGWSMMRGVINEPITDGVTRMVRMSVIVALSINVGYYNIYISDFLFNSPQLIAGAIAQGQSDYGSNAVFLDKLLGQMTDYGNLYRDAGYKVTEAAPDYGLIIIGYAIIAAGGFCTGYVAFLLTLAKVSLSVLTAIGPIFVLLMVFDATKRLFDAWMGQAIKAILLVGLTGAAMQLVLTVVQQFFESQSENTALLPAIDQAIPAIIFSIIASLIFIQVPAIASSLSEGVVVGTLGAVGWTMRRAKISTNVFSDSASSINSRDSHVNTVTSSFHKAGSSNGRLLKHRDSVPMSSYRKITT